MWEYNYNQSSDELYHYGVLGMKWGKRKSLPTSDIRNRYDTAKKERKEARKAYRQDFKKAFNGHPITAFIPGKKSIQRNTERLKSIEGGAKKVSAAKKKFVKVSYERSAALHNKYKELEKQTSIADKMKYSPATRKLAAKYIVDHNMSMAEATKKSKDVALRNTAIFAAIYGVTMASLYKK